MNAEVKNYSEKKKKFPVLLRASDSPLVVMFTGKTEGVAVFGTENRNLGEYRTDWVECDNEYWIKFTGEITLKND